MLVSGDVNFASELADLRNRHNMKVICVHGPHAAPGLLTHANETYSYEELVLNIPETVSPSKLSRSQARKMSGNGCGAATAVGGTGGGEEPLNEFVVSDLPGDKTVDQIRQRLKQLSSNCGGKVVCVEKTGDGATIATMRFASVDAAIRARKRMEGEMVYGNKITLLSSRPQASKLGADVPKDTPRNSRSRRTRVKNSPVKKRDSVSSSPLKKGRGGQVLNERQLNCSVDRQIDGFTVHNRPRNYSPATHESSSHQVVGREASPKCSLPVRDGTWYPTRRAQSPRHFSPRNSGKDTSPIAGRDKNLLESKEDTIANRGNDLFLSNMRKPFNQNIRAIHGVYPQGSYWGSYHGYRDWVRTNDVTGWPLKDGDASNSGHSSKNASPAFQDGASSDGQNSTQSEICKQQKLCSDARFKPINRDLSPYMSPRSSPQQHCGYGYVQGYGMVPNPAALFADAVELRVSNLDQNIPARDLRKVLFTVFRQFVGVLHISLLLQADKSLVAIVKVPTLEDAQIAIANLHRHKIGHKRIHVCIPSEKTISSEILQTEVTSLLSNVTGEAMPLFKFIELFEKRYHHSVSVSELYRMHEVIEIFDQDCSGRVVRLTNQPTGANQGDSDAKAADNQPDLPLCTRHCPVDSSFAWADTDDAYELPLIRMALRTFSVHVHMLLQLHEGSMPLCSFPVCFGSEFEPLENFPKTGVPLEHLLSAVPGVEINLSPLGVKQVQWAANKMAALECTQRSASPIITAQLLQFGREIVDLLKNSPGCRMAFSKFIPAYHHHFGRQCRVADYGYTKLIDLFQALSHIVQVIGEGSRKQITLTHRAQGKRFTSDILRCLKSQASKQIIVKELPEIYNKVMNKPFQITDYGICDLMDLLTELADNTVVLTGSNADMIIAIPKREQTSEEIERTGQFAQEVVDLLRHSPSCRMPFNKFIPAYHHHFGRQCRVADYGFTKLIELFEAITHVVSVNEKDDERYSDLF